MLKEKSIIRICVALSILLLPLAHLKVNIFGVPLYSVEMPVVVAGVIYLYGWKKGSFSPERSINFHNPIVWGMGLFLCGAILSFVANPASLTGLGMIKTWFIMPMILVWLWLQSKPEKQDIEKMLLIWFGAIAVVSFLSLTYLFQGILTFDNRLSFWYTSPNYLAFFLAPGVFLAQYFFSHPVFEKKQWSRLLIVCIFFSLLIVLFFTHSYATWGGVIIANGIFLFLHTTKESFFGKKAAAVVVVIIIFSGFIFFESGSEKWQALVSFQERSSLSSRMMIWQVATKALFERPFFGIGIGRFQEVYLLYQREFPLYLEWAVPQPHNLYLAIWLQTGIIGLIGFFLFITTWFKQLIHIRKSLKTTDNTKKISSLLLSVLLVCLIIGGVDTPFFKTDLAFIFWFIVAFGISLVEKE